MYLFNGNDLAFPMLNDRNSYRYRYFSWCFIILLLFSNGFIMSILEDNMNCIILIVPPHIYIFTLEIFFCTATTGLLMGKSINVHLDYTVAVRLQDGSSLLYICDE